MRVHCSAVGCEGQVLLGSAPPHLCGACAAGLVLCSPAPCTASLSPHSHRSHTAAILSALHEEGTDSGSESHARPHVSGSGSERRSKGLAHCRAELCLKPLLQLPRLTPLLQGGPAETVPSSLLLWVTMAGFTVISPLPWPGL